MTGYPFADRPRLTPTELLSWEVDQALGQYAARCAEAPKVVIPPEDEA